LKKGLKQTLEAVAFLALAVLLLWLSFKGIKLHDLWVSLSKAHYLWLLPAAIVSLLSFLIRARRWTLLLQPMGYNPRVVNAYHSVVTGYFANMIFPRLGEISKCAALGKKEKIPFDMLVGTMLVERTIDILTVVVLLGLTLISGSGAAGNFLSENVFTPAEEKLSSSLGSVTIITIIIIVLVAGAVILFFTLRRKLSSFPMFRKLYSFADGIISGLKSIGKIKRKWEFMLLTLFLWICYLLMSFFPLLCFDSTSDLGLGGAMFVLVVGSFGMAAPVQSGLGAYHWIVSRGLLVAYAIPLEEGLAYATLSHESQMILIAVFGALSLIAMFGTRGGKVLSKAVAEKKL
jgi:uncharacterized protein (TIRG00374 family)